LAWALKNGFPADVFEVRGGRTSWVLLRSEQKRNLYQARWWDFIAGSEHLWARALNSSQCFAVNLFAPLRDEAERARLLLAALLPERAILPGDQVMVQMEFTPKGAPKWFGESRQPTQVDVYFQVVRAGAAFGHLLVEVKYAETGFGCCRGGEDLRKARDNGCLDLANVLCYPQKNCWLARTEGRTYWQLLSKPSSSVKIDAIAKLEACPFRCGLYQMMRNRLLADELRERTNARWADFAVCIHPENVEVRSLKGPVPRPSAAIEAFRGLSSADAVLDWDAKWILDAVLSTGPGLEGWGDWMRSRYF
jgi:hypothetical protein